MKKNKKAILFSNKQKFGPELLEEGVITNLNGGVMVFIPNGLNASSDGSSPSSVRPRILWDSLSLGKQYKITITTTINSGNTTFSLYDGASYVFQESDIEDKDLVFTCGGSVFFAFNGTNNFDIDVVLSLKEIL